MKASASPAIRWADPPEPLVAQPIEVRSAEVLQHQGQPQDSIWFVHSGILKACHYTESGSERVKEFYFAGEFCFLYLSWLTGQPASYQIEAAEDAVVTELPLSWLDTEAAASTARNLLRTQLAFKERKEEMFLLHSPEQRYLYVLKNFPVWPSLLSQKQLAAYIGITEVSLSRIRSRLNKG